MTCDELLSDSFPYKEIENGILWEVEGKWVVQGAVSFDIGANPSAEGGEEDEGFDDQAVKVVDIVDTFRLQEQPPFDKKQFVAYVKKYIKLLTPKLEPEQQELFKKNIEGATKFLLSKLSDLQLYVHMFNLQSKLIFDDRMVLPYNFQFPSIDERPVQFCGGEHARRWYYGVCILQGRCDRSNISVLRSWSEGG
ncbi:hypothetical protein RJ639_002255 [Escallonia herrerae]|uniref:TCTP domain-containing protein n=1 Tax=Escallonia herrerae TaxID=1293975 RepID=A0AA88X8I0_9ASTE|nr:hypothetical protein RJ639_002255 [Escallonia herrerae]